MLALSVGGWLVLGGVLGALVLAVIGIYNAMVQLRMRVRNAWSHVSVQLKRRYDLIPNLVETVKGYAAHEKDTLERVIQARNMAMGAKGVADHAAAENMLTGALKSLFALSERYPDLKANQSFLALQNDLVGTEDKISSSRQHYNDVVERYNTKIATFPNNLLAGIFGFHPEQFFEMAEAERETPRVKF